MMCFITIRIELKKGLFQLIISTDWSTPTFTMSDSYISVFQVWLLLLVLTDVTEIIKNKAFEQWCNVICKI